MTLGRTASEEGCQGLTTGPLTEGKMWRKFEIKGQLEVASQNSLSSLMPGEALLFWKK